LLLTSPIPGITHVRRTRSDGIIYLDISLRCMNCSRPYFWWERLRGIVAAAEPVCHSHQKNLSCSTHSLPMGTLLPLNIKIPQWLKPAPALYGRPSVHCPSIHSGGRLFHIIRTHQGTG